MIGIYNEANLAETVVLWSVPRNVPFAFYDFFVDVAGGCNVVCRIGDFDSEFKSDFKERLNVGGQSRKARFDHIVMIGDRFNDLA